MRAPWSFQALAIAFVLASGGCVARPHAPGARDPSHAVAETTSDTPATSKAASAPLPECDDAKPPPPEDDVDADHTTIDDGLETPPAATAGPETALPFAELSDADITSRLKADIGALGSMSIGRAHGGVLVAGVRMPEGEHWEVVHPTLAWGTKETVDALSHAIDAVAARFPDTPKAFVGDISAKQGGHLHPHVSHQSGRDVDMSYYLTDGHRWYATANATNLDRARTWHLVRTLISDSDVDLILVDIQIQKVLKAYAREIGEDPAWLDEIFQAGGKSSRPILFHANGHASHLHVRFYSPMAQELGRRAYRFLLGRRFIAPPTLYITHTAKSGDTLSRLAVRYKVTPEAIKKANAMTRDVLRLNKPYKIPQTGGIAMPSRTVVPARRIPPPTKAVAVGAGVAGEPCRRSSPR
jgi:penicillin-insensitive murein endopeptidase